MLADAHAERKSIQLLAFDHYLRTGERLTEREWLIRSERKFNPYHDELGRFTSPPGVTVSYGNHAPQLNNQREFDGQRRGAKPATLTSMNSTAQGTTQGKRKQIAADPVKSRNRVTQQSGILPAKGLHARARAIGSGRNELIKMPKMHVVLFGPGVDLVPVPIASLQAFDSASIFASKAGDLDAVITGPQFTLLTGSEALRGQAMIGGRVYGNSAPDLYYFGTVTGSDGIRRLKFDKGDLSSAGVEQGFGGGVPLLIDGKDVSGYNRAWNRYNESSGVGKNIVAYNSHSNRSAIFIQPHSESGYSINSVRKYIRSSGYDYAIVFDGSDSTSLNYRNTQIVTPSFHKNMLIPLGIGFRSK